MTKQNKLTKARRQHLPCPSRSVCLPGWPAICTHACQPMYFWTYVNIEPVYLLACSIFGLLSCLFICILAYLFSASLSACLFLCSSRCELPPACKCMSVWKGVCVFVEASCVCFRIRLCACMHASPHKQATTAYARMLTGCFLMYTGSWQQES